MRKRTLFSIAAILAITVTLTGCNREDSNTVNQDTIWAWYRLVYDANSDITSARATFRFSSFAGTKLELVDNASITFNGEAIPWKNAIAYYEKEYAGLVEAGTFVYTDNDGNVFANTVEMPSALGFPPELDSLDINTAYPLNWTGEPLLEDEEVEVSLSGDNTTGTMQFFTASGEGEAAVVLGTDQLGNLGTGITTMFMEKTFTAEDMQTTGAGGRLQASYKAVNNENVVVTD